MTRLFAALIALGLAVPGLAVAQSSDVQRACDAINMLAPLVVQQRDSGAPQSEIMPYADMAEGEVRTLIQRMIADAYETKGSPEAFQARWVADCYASFK